jgi:hypothetical protein
MVRFTVRVRVGAKVGAFRLMSSTERREGALSRETSMGQEGGRLRGATAERSRLGQASSGAARAFSPTLGTPRGRRWGCVPRSDAPVAA